MVLFGYLAARCTLELVTGVLVLPQRQTALVAKQAAEADLLSRGRLRLSVGVGWNRPEYEAMGADFGRRGRLMDEQIEVLRRLWTEDVVSYDGEFHHIVGSGILTLPVQRPIPIWVGGVSPSALERVGRLGDGCMLNGSVEPGRSLDDVIERIARAALAAGRDPGALGVEGRLVLGDRSDDELRRLIAAWRDQGATHLCLDTRYGGRPTVVEHVQAIRRMADVAA